VFARSTSRPSVVGLAPTGLPTSGTPAQLLDQGGIDRAHIAEAVRSLVRTPR
jgi:hypothetical protein